MLNRIVNYFYRIYFDFIRKKFSKDIYLFNSPYGYHDNAKDLMLYFQNKGHLIFWITGKKRWLPRKNHLNRNSLLLKLILPRVKICFITHESNDICKQIPDPILIVNLWHGIALKKMGYDSDVDIKNMQLNEIKNPYDRNNFIISSSSITQKHMMSCMHFSAESVLPFGQPRTDILFNKSKANLLRKKIKAENYSSYKSIYLYAPTFRDSGYGTKIYKSVVNSFVKHADKDDLLILRLHPREKLEAKKIALLSDNVVISKFSDPINDLLVSDALISDYSSIIFDFMILSRPIFLYIPDIIEYKSVRSGFYFDYEKIMNGATFLKNEFEHKIWSNDLLHREYEYMSAKLLHRPNAASRIYNHFI